MVAGTDDHSGLLGDAPNVLLDDHGLHRAVQLAGDIQVIPRHHYEVEIRRGRDDPVELLQRIVQIGNQQQLHEAVPPILSPGASRTRLVRNQH
jgi:hypothetical protein